MIYKEALQNKKFGVTVDDNYINNIRYADETILLGNCCAKDYKQLLEIIHSLGKQYGLVIEEKRTKFAIKSIVMQRITINRKSIEVASEFKYLSSYITNSLLIRLLKLKGDVAMQKQL